eukprot:1019191-Karenia_brevis.AAC.1
MICSNECLWTAGTAVFSGERWHTASRQWCTASRNEFIVEGVNQNYDDDDDDANDADDADDDDDDDDDDGDDDYDD